MASYTPNLNLILPVGTEKVSRAIVNSNNTIIDGAIGGIINPSVESVGSLAALKTYLLSVASSATARKNVYVQFNVTAASSPFSAGLYTGNLQKETNGSFSVLCHGNAGGVVEVQYNATNTTWTITNFNSEISALNSNIKKLDSMAVMNNNIADFLKPAGSGQTAVYSVYGTIGGLFPSWAWGTLYVLEQQAIFDGAEASATGSIANAVYMNGTWTNISECVNTDVDTFTVSGIVHDLPAYRRVIGVRCVSPTGYIASIGCTNDVQWVVLKNIDGVYVPNGTNVTLEYYWVKD